MQVYTPRPYQLDCLAALAKAREDGVQRGLVVMASGLGKTLTAAFDIERYLQEHPNARILVLCHQESILLQTKRKFQQYFGEEYSYGMYSGSYKVTRRVDFTFATFQTMRGHREEFAADTFDYIVVDEAHHTPAVTYRPTVDYFQAQFLLGLTATKDRMDGQDILDVYGQTLFSMDIFEGWEQGYLARIEYNLMLNDLDEKTFKQYLQPQDANVKLTIDQLNKTFCCVQTDADLVASIRKETSDLTDPTIFIFCNSIAQVQSLAYHFGDEAAMVHSKQDYQQNQAVLDAFYAGEIKIILSVDMLNEGIDIPAADVVVFLRATDSLTVFFQQLGRGARITEGKRVLRVLDYVANVERLMMVLDLETTIKERLQEHDASRKIATSRLSPIEIKIPRVKFEVRKVELGLVLSSLREKPTWSRAKIIEAFRPLVKDNIYLTQDEINGVASSIGLPSVSTIKHYFPEWDDFLEAVGYKIDEDKRTKEQIASDYLALSLKREEWLSIDELKEYIPLFGYSMCIRLFGGIRALREYATGLDTTGRATSLKTPREYFTAQYIKEGMRKLATEKRRRPKISEIDDCTFLPTYQSCLTKFEITNMDDLCRVCGIDELLDELDKKYGPVMQPPRPSISEKEAQSLRGLVRKLGRRLRLKDLTSANGVLTASGFSYRKLRIGDINDLIGADQILAELDQENN